MCLKEILIEIIKTFHKPKYVFWYIKYVIWYMNYVIWYMNSFSYVFWYMKILVDNLIFQHFSTFSVDNFFIFKGLDYYLKL